MVLMFARYMVIEHSLPHAGQTYVYWFGDTLDAFIGDVDMVRQVLSNRMGLFPWMSISLAFLPRDSPSSMVTTGSAIGKLSTRPSMWTN
jgi:hypothetical protein